MRSRNLVSVMTTKCSPTVAQQAANAHLPALAALRSRRDTVVKIISARVAALSDPATDRDPEFQAGREHAIAAVLDYCVAAVERGEAWGPIPPALQAHARRAARIGIRPGVLIRGYLAGHREFIALLNDELQSSGEVRQQAALAYLGERFRPLLEHILTSIEHEYHQEYDLNSEDYLIQIVRRLLTQSIGQSELAALDYPIHLASHVGVVAVGSGATMLLRSIESKLGIALLVVPCGDVTWAWLGSRRRLDSDKIARVVTVNGAEGVALAIGSPHSGLDGWRQTHREAQSALLSVVRRPEPVTLYAENPLVTAALENETLAAWLRAFIRPLLDRPNGAAVLLPALRAYLDAGFNAAAAGAALGHKRHTITQRVRIAEQELRRPLRVCAPELDTAIRLHELDTAHQESLPGQLIMSPHIPVDERATQPITRQQIGRRAANRAGSAPSAAPLGPQSEPQQGCHLTATMADQEAFVAEDRGD